MARHGHRDHRGRWAKTASGAPIPDADGEADNTTYAHVVSPSANPQGERVLGVSTVYPEHDFSRGPVQHVIPHRNAIEIDGETGEALREIPDHELRARMPDLRTHAMLAATNAHGDVADDFMSELVTPPTGPDIRSERRIPGTGGYRLPAMGPRDDDAEGRGGC